MTERRFIWGLMAALSITAGSAAAQFTDVTSAAGITHLQANPSMVSHSPERVVMTGGAAAADYDNDGWVDIYFTRFDDTDVLYKNLGVDANGDHQGFLDMIAAAFGSSL